MNWSFVTVYNNAIPNQMYRNTKRISNAMQKRAFFYNIARVIIWSYTPRITPWIYTQKPKKKAFSLKIEQILRKSAFIWMKVHEQMEINIKRTHFDLHFDRSSEYQSDFREKHHISLHAYPNLVCAKNYLPWTDLWVFFCIKSFVSLSHSWTFVFCFCLSQILGI